MARKQGVEWFGADRETTGPDGRTTTAQLEPVDGTKPLRVSTSGKDGKIAELTARYKLMRSAAELAPPDDREAWEKRRDIAFTEMQIERFQQQLDKYIERGDPRPEQVQVYKDRLSMMKGRWLDLTGQEK